MKCPNCQLENPPSALRCDCGYDFTSGTLKDSYLPPKKPGKSARGTYIALCIVVAIVSLYLAIAIFNFTWMLYAGRALGQPAPGVGFVGFIVLAVYANRLWKSILAAEPEGNPLFKAKHKKFTFVAAACVGTLFAVSLLGGIIAGPGRARQDAKDREISSLMKEFGAQKIKNAAFRTRLAKIRSVHPSTYEEYYQQCLALETSLDQAQPSLKRNGALIASMSQLVNKYPEQKTPGTLATIQFLKDLDEKDAEIIAAMREEISNVKELERRPVAQRTAFYNHEIVPILAREQELAKEENAMLVKAQHNGV